MKEYIKKLQLKSEDARKQILVASLTVSMSLIAVVWMYSLGGLFSGKSTEVAKSDNEVKPFTMLSNSISSTYQNISASVGKIKNKKDQEAQVPEKQIDLIPVEYKN